MAATSPAAKAHLVAPRSERPPATFEAYDPEAYGQIVHPNRFDWYLITRWLPDLGNDGLAVVKVLRNELYYNPAKKALRDECEMSMEELARRCNLSRRTLFRLFEANAALRAFVQRQPQYALKGDAPHRDVNVFRVCMTDPIHPGDEEAYRLLLEARGAQKLATETGPKHRVKRDEPVDLYECHHGTHKGSMSAKTDAYACHGDTLSPSMSVTMALHKEMNLPSGYVTKESVTAAPAPPHKCVPPGGEEEPPDPLAALWRDVLERLAHRVNKPTLEAHLRPLRIASIADDGVVVLLAPHAATRDWIEKRHLPSVAEALKEVLSRSVTVHLRTSGEDRNGTANS